MPRRQAMLTNDHERNGTTADVMCVELMNNAQKKIEGGKCSKLSMPQTVKSDWLRDMLKL